ncbi:MAG: peptidylprolyl isomerase [Bacteroidota bacterium]|nr:peptidylprolyl isomerase [Bacteroidota bacterium]
MKYCRFSFPLILLLFLFSCDSEEQSEQRNIFADSLNFKIYELGYTKNTKQLIQLIQTQETLSSRNKITAARALAGLRDTLGIPVLINYLQSGDSLLKAEAVFALSRIPGKKTTHELKKAFNKAPNKYIQSLILKALGTAGSEEELIYLSDKLYNEKQPILLHGQLEGLAKLAEKNISSYKLLPRVVGILQSNNIHDSTKVTASYYLSRSKPELTDFENDLIQVYHSSTLLTVKTNLLKAFSNTKHPKLKQFILRIVKTPDIDYRVTVNALRALQPYDYDSISKAVRPMLVAKNIHKAKAAAEFFYAKGTVQDSAFYLSQATRISDWNINTVLWATALRYSEQKDKINKQILKKYTLSQNNYEKAALLNALRNYYKNYKFLADEMFKSEVYVLKYAAISALNYIQLSSGYDGFFKGLTSEEQKTLETEFSQTYKRAILSRDVALVSTAAELLMNPSFEARRLYKNTFFVKQAVNNCNLPADLEAWQQLLKLDRYLNGTSTKPKIAQRYYRHLNRDSIARILPRQKIRVFTEKGNFDIELQVNKAPQSVATFLLLINQRYYDDKIVHRVVSDFVIQDGCSRGDGWGSPAFVIRTEPVNESYTEGSVGLASAGNDTESAQWFVCQSATPHLDANYTLFGKVVQGMEVVHRIQVGDKIHKIRPFKE